MTNRRRNSELVRSYFKNGCLSKKDLLTAAFNKKIPYALNAKKISSLLAEKHKPEEGIVDKVTIHLKSYTGNNPFAKRMISFLDQHLKNDLVGAYAHGSVGTGEEVAYSDFDGFVIIKDDPLQNPSRLQRIAFLLNQSEKIMTEMDPLQHHGWFILTESDLKNYPEDYLPHELWEYSSALTGATELVIHVKQNGYRDEFIGAYHRFSNHLIKNLRSRKFLNDNYDLKSVLSGFMLLPSIYLQAKTGKAVFKKFSFDMLRKETGSSYAIMDEVSALRASWDYKPSVYYKALLARKPFLLSYFFKKKISGKISAQMQQTLDNDFIQRMISFVEMLNKSLGR